MEFQLIARSCPVCGNSDSPVEHAATVRPEQLNEFAFASRKLPEYMHWALKSCPKCHVLYADPAPHPDDLHRCYREAAFDGGRESKFAAQTYADIVRKILPSLPDQDQALDIGAGDGAFVERLQALGFRRPLGVEPSKAPVESAPESVRPLLRLESFQVQNFEPASFDLVTCFQTIEHLYEPLQFCRDAWTLLKPGGVLLLVGHNRKALSARIMGTRSPIYDLEHLQLFCPESMKQLMNHSGFEKINIEPIVNRYPLAYWLRLSPIPGSLKKVFIPMSEKLQLGKIIIPVTAGNLMSYGYKRAAA